MTALEALQALKKYLEEEVAPSILLQKEYSDPPEFVHPYVSIITLPHKNFVPANFQVPHILIGLVQGDDDTDENTLQIRIACATYGGSVGFQEENNIPDEKGYIDLLTLIERIKLKLVEDTIIGGACVVDKPMQYGIYDEQITYPYWYGYLQFPAQIAATQRNVINKTDFSNIL